MRETNKPTIAELLDYIKICDEGIRHYSTKEEETVDILSPDYVPNRKRVMNEMLVSDLEMLKNKIVRDLLKNPGFVAYATNVMPEPGQLTGLLYITQSEQEQQEPTHQITKQ